MLIEGVVRSNDGRVLDWAAVSFVSGPIPLPDTAAITSDRGEFALTAPVSGRYRIGCRAEDHDYSEFDVDVGSDDVTVGLELEPTGPAPAATDPNA